MPPDPSERFATPLLISVRDPENPEPFDRQARAWQEYYATRSWEPLYEAGIFARPDDVTDEMPENADEPPGPRHDDERVTPLREVGEHGNATD